MQIATLLTAPATPRLDGTTVEAVRNAWGGGMIDWLASDVAAQFPLERIPENRWEVWEEMQALGLDLVLQPAEGRRKKLLIADMDSTMIEQECVDELAEMAGVGAHVAEITRRAMNGELEFEGALRERVALLRGLEVNVIARVLSERITYMPGAQELLATMRANGAHTVLVSGGFTAFTQAVAAHLGFHEHRANTLNTEGAQLSGTVAEPILGRAAKVAALEEVSAQLGITPADAIAVGDGANDLGMLALSGTGVALHAKPSVQAQCDIRVNHGDLTALLFIQGYCVADFAGSQKTGKPEG